MSSQKQNKEKKLETSSYKGVRDFYPEEQFIQNYITDIWRMAVESFGYVEYSASILEPAELYAAKTGEEIVNEQTYTFTDRGDRDVTLRPEMTPTLARMVAAKKRELSFPLRWYSIPNLFRYERPQRGRLREHWQLNADIFGGSETLADAELILLASYVMESFGLEREKFSIHINDRRLLSYILNDLLELPEEKAYSVSKLLDKKDKMENNKFDESLRKLIGEKAETLTDLMTTQSIAELKEKLTESKAQEILDNLLALKKELEESGVENVVFNPALVRGLDYYTGFVFEGFDNDPENRRALFGGGRYDELLSIFGEENVPAAGFGMGDVTMRNMLETYNLLPDYRSPIDLSICTLDDTSASYAQKFAMRLRDAGINASVDISGKKVGDQIARADKEKIPFILCIGENEIEKRLYTVKELKTGEEIQLEESSIAEFITEKLTENLK